MTSYSARVNTCRVVLELFFSFAAFSAWSYDDEHTLCTSFQMSVRDEEFSRRSDIDVIMPVISLTYSEMSMVCDCSASVIP
jgi:hypothetical protein